MAEGFYCSQGEDAGFSMTVVVSICLHIVFITAIFLFSNHSSSKIFTAPLYTVDLVVPEKPIAPPKVIESESQRVNESKIQRVKEEKAVALKKGKEPSLDETLKKLKQRVKKREAEEAVSKRIEELENKQLEKRIKEIKERVVHRQGIVKPVKAKGSEFAQKVDIVKRSEGLEEKYAQIIGDLIHDKWNYTAEIKQGEVAVINLNIDKSGHLVGSHVEQSSGNEMLVQSAVRAIEKAALLFPPLPQELGKDFVEIGVCFPKCAKE